MKKRCLIFAVFYAFNSLMPMDVVTLNKENDVLIEMGYLAKRQQKINNGSLVRHTDWPFISLQKLTSNIKKVPRKVIKQIYKDKSPSLLGMIYALPQETIESIVGKMLDDDEIAIKLFMNMPIIHAFKHYQDAKAKLTLYPQMKDKSVGIFFRTSEEQKQKILSVVKPKTITQFFLGEKTAMTQEELEELNELDTETRDEFVVGQEVVVVDRKIDICLLKIGCFSLAGCTALGGMIYGIWSVGNYTSMPLLPQVMMVGSCSSIGIVLTIGTLYRMIKDYRANAQDTIL